MRAEFRVRPNGEVQIHVRTETELECDLMARFTEMMATARGNVWSPSGGSHHGITGIVSRDIVFAPGPFPEDGGAT